MKNIILLVFLICLTRPAFAIYCYQCKSTDLDNPFQCNEYMEDSELKPLPCDTVYDAQFCIKQTGRFEGGLGTERFCSRLDLGNYCNYIQQPGDELEYRSCVYTCQGDGCNSSNLISSSISTCLFIFIVFYFIRI